MYGCTRRDLCEGFIFTTHAHTYTGAESESDDGFYDFAGDVGAGPVKRTQTVEAEKAYERGKVKLDSAHWAGVLSAISTCAMHLPLESVRAIQSQRRGYVVPQETRNAS